MNQAYETIEMEIIRFEQDNVITESGWGPFYPVGIDTPTDDH